MQSNAKIHPQDDFLTPLRLEIFLKLTRCWHQTRLTPKPCSLSTPAHRLSGPPARRRHTTTHLIRARSNRTHRSTRWLLPILRPPICRSPHVTGSRVQSSRSENYPRRPVEPLRCTRRRNDDDPWRNPRLAVPLTALTETLVNLVYPDPHEPGYPFTRSDCIKPTMPPPTSSFSAKLTTETILKPSSKIKCIG